MRTQCDSQWGKSQQATRQQYSREGKREKQIEREMEEIEFTTTKAAHELHGAHYVQQQRIELLLVIQDIKHV